VSYRISAIAFLLATSCAHPNSSTSVPASASKSEPPPAPSALTVAAENPCKHQWTEERGWHPGACTQALCASQGGRWDIHGLNDTPFCDLPTSDARKPCNDSSECESVCAVDERRPAPAGFTGRCYSWSVLVGTCLNYVSEGRPLGTLCAD
jgi:hypothetical protein